MVKEYMNGSKNRDTDRDLTVERLKKKLAVAELGVENLQIENRNLIVQINQLQFELLRLRRVLPVIKLLLKVLDAAALNRIKRLNKPRTKREKPLDLPNSRDAAVILKYLRLYDLDNYYTLQSDDRFAYKLVHTPYMLLTRGLLKLMLRMVKIVKRS